MTAEQDLARLERQILGVARVSTFFGAVETIRRLLAREDPRVTRAILALTAPAIGKELAAAISAAFDIGIREAVSLIGEGAPDRLPKTAPAYLVALARQAQRDIASDVAKARALAAIDPSAAFAAASSAETRIRRSVTTLVGGAGNAGTTAVADLANLPTVWVAETNACVTCLAYSGKVAKPGKKFPKGLSYGPRSTVASPLDYPPAHPNCRCTVEPLNSQEYADALRREADRSVLRGFSLTSESVATRVEAARRLLAEGVDAPKSVIAYAQRAVKAGKFPSRGRG